MKINTILEKLKNLTKKQKTISALIVFTTLVILLLAIKLLSNSVQSDSAKNSPISYPVSYLVTQSSNEGTNTSTIASYPVQTQNIPKSISYSVVTSGYDNSTKTITQNVNSGQQMIALFVVNSIGYDGISCNSEVFKYSDANIKSLFETKSYILNSYNGNNLTFQLDPGNYDIVFSCPIDDGLNSLETYRAVVIQNPVSY